MAIIHPLQVLVVLLCTFSVFVFAGEVVMGGFHMNYGMTGCLSDPTRDCVDNKNGDTCYVDRGLGFAITGTAPICNACMPFNHRNIATYQYPSNLPCALWRFYQCDDVFVTNVWKKSGLNGCLSGRKSYNMNNWFGSAAENENKFIEQCRQQKSLAHYRLPPATLIITEEKFCFPLRDNITMIDATQTNLPTYKQYYDNKYLKKD